MRAGRIRFVRVVVEVVLEEDLQEDGDGEDGFVEGDAPADGFDCVGDEFPGGLVVVYDGFAVLLLDEVGPG